jgi:hypothetical protein
MSLGKKTVGRSWAVSLLVQLWQLSWNQWDNRNDIDKNTLHFGKTGAIRNSEQPH